jgi:DNA (cytosine-5)-methyltransferase 1
MDLFAGCGGLSLGLQEAGLEVRWANEHDGHAAETYRQSHPGVRVFQSDARSLFQQLLDGGTRLPRKGDVDLLVGGPPCQGFSGYNRYRKRSDPRNSLVEVFLDFVDFLKPNFVLIENVPGMLSLDSGRAIRLLLASLQELGYRVALGILQAGHYGLPQNRWRVFVWGAAVGSRIPGFPQPTHQFPRTTIFGATAFRKHVVTSPNADATLFWRPQSMVTVGDAISDLPPIENGGGADEMNYDGEPSTEYQRTARKGSTNLCDHRCAKLGELMHARCKAVPKRPGAGWLDLPQHLKPTNLLRHGDKRYDNRFGRLHWSRTFNTILTRPYPYWGTVFHPEQERVISVREAARAQGFPDAVRFCGPLSARYVQVGNAVPPPLARALGLELVRAVTGGRDSV